MSIKKILENFAYKLILIFDRINYFWNQKKPLKGKNFKF